MPPTPWRRPASAASPGVRRPRVLTGSFAYAPLSAQYISQDSADVPAETKVLCITFTRIYHVYKYNKYMHYTRENIMYMQR